jgi:hypothetical protein
MCTAISDFSIFSIFFKFSRFLVSIFFDFSDFFSNSGFQVLMCHREVPNSAPTSTPTSLRHRHSLGHSERYENENINGWKLGMRRREEEEKGT